MIALHFGPQHTSFRESKLSQIAAIHINEFFRNAEANGRVERHDKSGVTVDLMAHSANGQLIVFEVKGIEHGRSLSFSSYLSTAALRDELNDITSDQRPILVLLTNASISEPVKAVFDNAGIPAITLGHSATETAKRIRDAFKQLSIQLPELATTPMSSAPDSPYADDANDQEASNSVGLFLDSLMNNLFKLRDDYSCASVLLLGYQRAPFLRKYFVTRGGMLQKLGYPHSKPNPMEEGVLQSGNPNLLPDVLDSSEKRKIGWRQLRSVLCVPIRTGQEVIGVLTLESTKPGAFSDDDVALTKLFASQAAMMLNNAAKLEALRGRASELKELRNFLKAIEEAPLPFLTLYDRSLVNISESADFKTIIEEIVKDVTIQQKRQAVQVNYANPDNLPQIYGNKLALKEAARYLMLKATNYSKETTMFVNIGLQPSENERRIVIKMTMRQPDQGAAQGKATPLRIYRYPWGYAPHWSREPAFQGHEQPWYSELPTFSAGMSILRAWIESQGGKMVINEQEGGWPEITVLLPIHYWTKNIS